MFSHLILTTIPQGRFFPDLVCGEEIIDAPRNFTTSLTYSQAKPGCELNALRLQDLRFLIPHRASHFVKPLLKFEP